jgi:endonuclease YncB( thermonuclease family)
VSKRQSGRRYAISRLNRTLIVLLCLLIAFIFGWLDHTQKNWRPALPIKTESRVKAGDTEKYQGKTFTVIYVVDGDTIDINIPDGQYDYTRIRLWGVDTPETKAPNQPVGYFGPEASEFTTKTTLGKNVQIFLDSKSTRDKYDRLLAYIKLDDGQFLNEVLLSGGYAYADRRFKHQFYNKYKQLESAARIGKKGLWANVSREQLPEWLQEKEPTLLKKK